VEELDRLAAAALHASLNGQQVNAGHGLNLRNVMPVAAIPGLQELHIGHSIVSHAIMVGMERATREMVDAIYKAHVLSAQFSPAAILQQF
jgi:pyridoxine 5-phosphate synthase